MKKYSELNGNWEERGVIGTRIEISNGKITILWRNSPTLQTSFGVEKDGDTLILKLKDKKLRHWPSGEEYAEVALISYENDRLTFKEMFPISGVSTDILTKTETSRYGNYKIVDKDVFPLLNGKWEDESGYHKLKFSNGKLTINGETIKIHVLKSNYEYTPANEFKIVDEDPSKYEVLYLSHMTFSKGELTATIPVCDAPSIDVVFHRV